MTYTEIILFSLGMLVVFCSGCGMVVFAAFTYKTARGLLASIPQPNNEAIKQPERDGAQNAG